MAAKRSVPLRGSRGLLEAGMDRGRFVEPDQVRHAVSQTLPWGVDHIDADVAWASSQGGGAKVAMLDSGGDFDHLDLSYAGGVNFSGKRKDGSTSPRDWDDVNGHGTWVSGIAAALNNSIGVVGVAPAALVISANPLGRHWGSVRPMVVKGVRPKESLALSL